MAKPTASTDPLSVAQRALARKKPYLNKARTSLAEAKASATEAGVQTVADFVNLQLSLLDLLDSIGNGDTSQSIISFCHDGIDSVRAAMDQNSGAEERLQELTERAQGSWGEYLELLTDAVGPQEDDWSSGAWTSGSEGTEQGRESEVDASGIDLTEILASLGQATATEEASDPNILVDPAEPVAQANGSNAKPFASKIPQPPQAEHPEMDAELLEAYMDDATSCVASMEQCLLTIDSDPSNVDAMQQFCRELHTLKGASGSVELSALASYLHELEDYVEATHKAGGVLDVDPVLKGVDVVRDQLCILTGGTIPTADAPALPATQSPVTGGETRWPAAPAGAEMEGSIRVESARLGRLMDLLAELVSLRNRRDSYVSELRDLHTSISSCVSRMRTLTDRLSNSAESDEGENAVQGSSRHATYRARELAELCSDVAELNRSLRDVFDPLGDDNKSVSHLIGEFRRELMDLQRVPVAGLFRRLHRGARDAAKAECKQVEIHFQGDDVRLERSLQERLYEPLLHVVRNAVSHGIESAEDRSGTGKSEGGNITLVARSNATSLMFEVRDDGKGLDYERLEQKGRERGLIPVGHMPSHASLARLIFHPGFSTKNEVSEISGRGVGMDVVSTQVHRMRGRVEIDSTHGSGTHIRLQIPLRSAIEHAMVVRCEGQLFALPMQFVQAARPDASNLPKATPKEKLSHLLGSTGTGGDAPGQLVVLGHHDALDDGSSRRLAIEVDAVIGAEEVVVRALPSLLTGHPLFSGLTLSGHGETVLLLDVSRLFEMAENGAFSSEGALSDQSGLESQQQRPRVLVVDDSLSTRRTHVRLAQSAGYETDEAADGLQALKMLGTNSYTAVLTDLEMPRLGGFELVSEIKQRRRIANIPVMVITSRGDEETHSRLRTLGADTVVVKPLTNAVFDDLKLLIEQSEATTAAAAESLQTT